MKEEENGSNYNSFSVPTDKSLYRDSRQQRALIQQCLEDLKTYGIERD